MSTCKRTSSRVSLSITPKHPALYNTQSVLESNIIYSDCLADCPRRQPSGADTTTAHCSGAHPRKRTAMRLCSHPQHAASERCRRTQTTQRSSLDAASAAYTGPLHTGSSSALFTVLAVVVVADAIDLPDSNHRSEAVLEHSRRSGRSRSLATSKACSISTTADDKLRALPLHTVGSAAPSCPLGAASPSSAIAKLLFRLVIIASALTFVGSTRKQWLRLMTQRVSRHAQLLRIAVSFSCRVPTSRAFSTSRAAASFRSGLVLSFFCSSLLTAKLKKCPVLSKSVRKCPKSTNGRHPEPILVSDRPRRHQVDMFRSRGPRPLPLPPAGRHTAYPPSPNNVTFFR